MSNDYPLPSIVKNSKDDFLQKLKNLSYESLEEATKAFVRQSGLRLKAGNWLFDERPGEAFCQGDVGDFKILEEQKVSSLFTPYVEKHLIPSGSKVIVFGDLHGDIESFVTILQHLQREGYIDDEYQLTSDDYYIVFIGDYTNRGPFSVEVMMLLFHLYSCNIGKVFLLRGNHEYAICNRFMYQRFQEEGREVGQETLLGELASKFDLYYFPDLLYWYDYLPLACYLGCVDEETGKNNMIQFCHAGLEVGYNPESLLVSEEARFQKITKLNRYNALQKIKNEKELEHLYKNIKEVLGSLEGTDMQKLAHTYGKQGGIDFNDSHSPLRFKFGMQWNNFFTEDDDAGFTASLQKKNMYFGREITEYFLKKWGGPKANLLSIVRGHQHLNEFHDEMNLKSNMLDRIKAEKGCARQWDGMLYTLGDMGMVTGYQSFAIVTMKSKVEKWKLEHFFKRPEEKQFTSESYKMLGAL